jgi:mitosis inhibitor protein kinase SWE1
VDLEASSPELVELIRNMMRTDPGKRLTMGQICAHPVVRRAREKMENLHDELKREGRSTWGASPLASVGSEFLQDILGTMDVDR